MWVRKGDCPPERCQGACCGWQGIWFDKGDPEVEKFLYTQQVRGSKVLDVGDKYLLENNIGCQFLKPGGLCGLHPSQRPSPMLPKRPEFCAEWPTEPGQLLNMGGHCGFYFVEVPDEDVLVTAQEIS